ncbi:TrpB-like pyridoxal phosphate-dependent enzyme [Thermofilum pendens]|uniref:Tryptophan synthase beta chain n=1 Tax=Thermofilum pendens (strain DSM 2475 / Hrk 5) TaxID=368408 RepID=A1RYL1_THEPD|nr:TrpB-like pyridoxal phosphate-dependent enzyme [Thermofilum pendens]ABL78291.1 pyridoxal-phosphate dependent TrpB-like enzyme [Thermofilum pendens Hrk 5]
MSKKYFLDEEELPREWYNILPDLPEPLPPPLNPATGKPVSPEDLEPIFPKELIRQEVSQERFIPIPEEVLEVYRIWRPTPLIRATRLEKALRTPARIYYKYEGVSPPGSHKPNTAVAQAYYNAREGVARLTTETGAGQWGSALSFATMLFGLKLTVYMVRVSYQQKPYRAILMQTWGAEVVPSPSNRTKAGRAFLEKDPEHPGSLGIAISEALEDAIEHEDTKYSLGSVLNHVLLHQTIIGLEAIKQMQALDEFPDIVIGCVGGGSNFAGISYPFYYLVRSGKAPKKTRFLAVEPASCPSMTKGEYMYDFGDTARLTPLLKMYTLGHDFVPPPIHAGGLRYHGAAPTLSLLKKAGIFESVAYNQVEVFEAARLFARTEGIVPAPESAHAIKAVIDEALEAKRKGEEKVILFNLSGHGLLDLAAYREFLEGRLPAHEYPAEAIQKSIAKIKEYLLARGIQP